MSTTGTDATTKPGWRFPERLDALILAGADNSGRLRESSAEAYEALIPIGARPMVAYVVDALSKAQRVGRLVCVAPPAVTSQTEASLEESGWGEAASRWVAVRAAGRLIDNLERGLQATSSSHVLVVTSDIPLLKPHMVDDFVARCEASPEELDVWYAIVERSEGEARYPGVRRTWVKLVDGTFTGGNILVVERQIVDRTRRMLTMAIESRKSPLMLAKLLGLRSVWRYLRGTLTIADVERRVQQMLGVRGAAVVTPYPEIGIDVDKPSDLEMARRHLVTAQAQA